MEIGAIRKLPLVKNRSVSMVLAILGMVDAAYLTWVKLADAMATCSDIGDCELVNTSRYSEIGGIPIAALGAAAYLSIVALLAAEKRYPNYGLSLKTGVFGITLAGTLYSAYLTFIEVSVLHAICPFCVLSAVLMTALLVLSVFRLEIWEP